MAAALSGADGTELCTAGTATQPFQLGAKGVPLLPPQPASRELPAKVPGCEDGGNIPVPGQEADQHFLLHQLQAASWGIIRENNGPFLPLI